MAQALEQDMFTLTWHIINFSMCPLNKKECIRTPEFVVDALDKTTWYLALYPKGDDSSNGEGVYVYLHRSNKDEEPDEVTIKFDSAVISDDERWERLFVNSLPITIAKNIGHGCKKLVTTEELSKNKNTLAPNDVFSLLCCMQRGTQPSVKPEKVCSFDLTNTYLIEEIFTLKSEVSSSKKMCIEHCIINTRIPVERRLITWVIKDFKTQTQSGKKVNVSALSNLREKSELLLSCYLSEQCEKHRRVKIDIQRKDKNFNQMLMRCKVSVRGNHGFSLKPKEAEHLFGENCEVWSFPNLVKLSSMQKPKFDCLKGNVLKLKLEFLISYKGEEVTFGGNCLRNNPIGPDGLWRDIRGLLDDKHLTDVTLNAEGFDLPVHKSLICARSPVFRRMFSNDTEEKRTGVVRITDIDVNTLKNMRNFIYEDCLPDLELEDMKRLYSAADKYEILSLKKLCVASLKFSLSISNLCDVLVLADLHHDADLLKGVHSFIYFHLAEVFHSDEWLNLVAINIQLAEETLKTISTWKDNS